MKPLAIDLCCGLGGWADGLLAEGWYVVGFDIERHVYGEHRYPAQLVILTLHGSQCRHAGLIVASPPCQGYSYRAMPWSRAKALPPPDNTLFETCFRIQREACEAAGRHIPMIVENVRGAQRWGGRARWHYGSYYLWGDVPALMPTTAAYKSAGLNWSDRTKRGQDFTRVAGRRAMDQHKHDGSGWRENGTPQSSNRMVPDGIKQGGNWWHDPNSVSRQSSSKSPRRKEASAMIAKIPFPLAHHIGAVFHPHRSR